MNSFLTHPDKMLFPDSGIRKADLAKYYHKLSKYILPYIRNRPISVFRCPEGIKGECFLQRHHRKGWPEPVQSIPITEEDGEQAPYLMIKSRSGLLALVQMNVLEIHPWGARFGKVEKPDVLILDIDPGDDTPWPQVIEAAWEIRERLRDYKLQCFVKTTGGKGLHVVAPLQRRQSWERLKSFARQIALRMEADRPGRYITNPRKSKRTAKIFIDYLRNERSATAIAPYSVRARAGAPVATPLAWEELSDLENAQAYQLSSLPRRLDHLRQNPWKGYNGLRQWITKAMAPEHS